MKKLFLMMALIAGMAMLSSCKYYYKSILKLGAEQQNAMCPQDKGNGMVMTGVEFSGNDIIYFWEIEGKIFEEVKSLEYLLKEMMITELKNRSDDDAIMVRKYLKKSGMGMKYIFSSSASDEKIEIIVEPDEV